MQDPIQLISNPYENLYRSFNMKTGQTCSRNQAQSLARHLGFIHNTFGLAIKDFISIIKHKFGDEKTHVEPMIEEKFERSKIDVEQTVQNIRWNEQYKLIDQKTKNNKKQDLKFTTQLQTHSRTETIPIVPTEVIKINQPPVSFNPACFEYKPQIKQAPPESKKINNGIKKKDVIDLDDEDNL